MNKEVKKKCENEQCTRIRVSGERFCYGCKQIYMRNMTVSGYLTDLHTSGQRSECMRENIRQTKFGYE